MLYTKSPPHFLFKDKNVSLTVGCEHHKGVRKGQILQRIYVLHFRRLGLGLTGYGCPVNWPRP